VVRAFYEGYKMVICPNCGEIPKNEISIFNKNLRKQNFDLTPILPTCKQCNSEVSILNICSRGNIIVINGTCGSGKSTVAELLVKRNFSAIDGDCVLQTVKHRLSQKSIHFQEPCIFDEIAYEIDILSMYGDNFVLSHILMPEDMGKYIEMFNARNLTYRFILLKPDYEIAVERCRTRTCHRSVTPEQWIKHFYDALEFDNIVEVINNSDMTASETVNCILNSKHPLPLS